MLNTYCKDQNDIYISYPTDKTQSSKAQIN